MSALGMLQMSRKEGLYHFDIPQTGSRELGVLFMYTGGMVYDLCVI